MRRIEFIAAMFCLALAGLLVGGMNLYERLEFSYFGRSAHMELADPAKKRALVANDQSLQLMDVKYVGPDGTVLVPAKRIWGDAAKRVGSGERVPITYLKHAPQRVLYPYEELDSPWGWLVVGVLSLVAAVYGLRLRRREALG
jgi:hypothetical protein